MSVMAFSAKKGVPKRCADQAIAAASISCGQNQSTSETASNQLDRKAQPALFHPRHLDRCRLGGHRRHLRMGVARQSST